MIDHLVAPEIGKGSQFKSFWQTGSMYREATIAISRAGTTVDLQERNQGICRFLSPWSQPGGGNPTSSRCSLISMRANDEGYLSIRPIFRDKDGGCALNEEAEFRFRRRLWKTGEKNWSAAGFRKLFDFR